MVTVVTAVLRPPPAGPNRSKLQDMLAHLVDQDDGVLPPSIPPLLPDPGPPGVPELEDTHPGEGSGLCVCL